MFGIHKVTTHGPAMVQDEQEYVQYGLGSNIVDPEVLLDKPTRRGVPSEFADLPEFQNMTSTDDFFDNAEDVIAVYDFDYRKMELFYTAVGCTLFGLTLLTDSSVVFSSAGTGSVLSGEKCQLGGSMSTCCHYTGWNQVCPRQASNLLWSSMHRSGKIDQNRYFNMF
jgi:hypothetical protein